MKRIEKIEKFFKEVYIIDYSDCKEAEMIGLVTELKKQVVGEGRPILILSVFNDRCYITPKFMRHAEQQTREALHLIEKQAMVGLSETKKIILKGYNLLFRKNIKTFDNREEAMAYLLDENTTDKDGC